MLDARVSMPSNNQVQIVHVFFVFVFDIQISVAEIMIDSIESYCFPSNLHLEGREK